MDGKCASTLKHTWGLGNQLFLFWTKEPRESGEFGPARHVGPVEGNETLPIFDTGVWPFQVGAWNSQTCISPFQFGDEIAKYPCLVHSEIVHPVSGHFKSTENVRHPCLLIWGVWPFRYTGTSHSGQTIRTSQQTEIQRL